MAAEQQTGRDTATGTDPQARYDQPGYEDKSLGQAAAQDAELAERLASETGDLEEAERRFETEAAGAPALHDRPATDPDTSDSDRLLRIYLNDHLAGAGVGVEIARRTRDENAGTDMGRFLSDLHHDLVEDRDTLERFIRQLGHRPSRVKSTLGVASAKLGSLKPSGRVTSYSPLSRVLELESLIAGVLAKRRLWETLRFVEPSDGHIDAGELQRLIERADRQFDGLQRQHRLAVIVAFSGADRHE
jgi:hypothetical protein